MLGSRANRFAPVLPDGIVHTKKTPAGAAVTHALNTATVFVILRARNGEAWVRFDGDDAAVDEGFPLADTERLELEVAPGVDLSIFAAAGVDVHVFEVKGEVAS